MKRIILFLAFTLALNAEILTIKEGGALVEKIYILKQDKFYVSDYKFFTNEDKIIIVFEDKSKKDLLESKYNLLEGKVFYGEKFIYSQNSSNILELLKAISKEKNVKTVYPNWTTVYHKN